jgi:hypothetical protein
VEWIDDNPLAGLQVMVDHSHGESDIVYGSTGLTTSLTNAGATVQLNYAPITLARLLEFDVVLIPGSFLISTWTPDEVEAARDYVRSLGGILVEASSANGVQRANAISAALGAGIIAGSQSGAGQVFTSNIQPAPITRGIDLLHLEYGFGVTSLAPPGQELVRYDSLASRRHAAVAELGGRLMVSGDEFHSDLYIGGSSDNLAFGMQAFAWLGRTPSVKIDNTGGSLAVGTPDTISVTLDATHLVAGSYPARVVIKSNDPLSQSVSVPVSATVTGTPVATRLPLPRRTVLLQNVPNPFNPTTTIRFELSQPADVRLEIYSVRGERIRTLVSGARPAGSHAVVWDGRDRRGAAVASGVYFYRLEAGRFARTRKMVLLK